MNEGLTGLERHEELKWIHVVPAEVEQEWIPHIGGSGAGQSWLVFRDVEWPPLLLRCGDDGNAKLPSLETQTLGLDENTHMQTHREAQKPAHAHDV
ncbi:hypothetical protein Q8A67_024458 [Cirrhinus molitorella]|uniref:Uncharacterized protein n=1 Tax=Cirrhinus molitorella TaxID=172907 RepID=A0AA88NYI0_9TELE|nr:hypothetical protein Q8A67_024458 [Cirrhinus molitorella]